MFKGIFSYFLLKIDEKCAFFVNLVIEHPNIPFLSLSVVLLLEGCTLFFQHSTMGYPTGGGRIFYWKRSSILPMSTRESSTRESHLLEGNLLFLRCQLGSSTRGVMYLKWVFYPCNAPLGVSYQREPFIERRSYISR